MPRFNRLSSAQLKIARFFGGNFIKWDGTIAQSTPRIFNRSRAIVHDKNLMLFMYTKNEQDDLTPDQLKVLRKIIEDEYP